jgi:hypothetical protein
MAPIENDVSDEDWRHDNEVSDNAVIWRVIHAEWLRDHPSVPGKTIASDQAYRRRELSVFLASKTTQEKVLTRWPDSSLAWLTAEFIRKELGLIIVHDPKDTDPDPAHRLVGRADHIQISKGVAHQIALKAEWVLLNRRPSS